MMARGFARDEQMSIRREIVVYERSGRWAVALRQTLNAAARAATQSAQSQRTRLHDGRPAGDVRVVETRSADECLAALADAPQAFVALELAEATCDAALELLRSTAERFPAARAVVLADRELASYEWLARELGAAHFVCSPRKLRAVARLAEAHWRCTPEPEIGVVERIWASLPWK
jgi:hypothetical protein